MLFLVVCCFDVFVREIFSHETMYMNLNAANVRKYVIWQSLRRNCGFVLPNVCGRETLDFFRREQNLLNEIAGNFIKIGVERKRINRFPLEYFNTVDSIWPLKSPTAALHTRSIRTYINSIFQVTCRIKFTCSHLRYLRC